MYYGGLGIFDDEALGSVTRELVVARVSWLVATQLREQACRGVKLQHVTKPLNLLELDPPLFQ